MKTLYTNGCSFSSKLYIPPDYKSCAVDMPWPICLGNIMGYEVVNHAEPGGSNDRILRTSLTWLSENVSRDVLVILQPTHGIRREFYSLESKWINFKNDSYSWQRRDNEKDAMYTYEKYFMMDEESQIRSLNQIISLQQFLELNKITYYFLGTGYCNRETFNDHCMKKFINWDKWLVANFSLYGNYHDDTEIRQLYYEPGHLNNKGHQKISEEMFQEIIDLHEF